TINTESTELSSINKSCSHVLDDFSRVAARYKTHLISGLCSRRERVKSELMAPQNWDKLAKDRHPYRKVSGPLGWGFWQWVSNLLLVKIILAQRTVKKPRIQDGNILRRPLALERTMIVGTWNVNSFTNKVAEVFEEISQLNTSIFGLSILHFWSGVEKSQKGQADISILIRKDLERHIADYNFISERLLAVTLMIYGLETVVSKEGAYCGSDHRLLVANLVVPHQTSRSGTRTGLAPEEQGTSISEEERKRYRLDLLQQGSIKHIYQKRLDSALAEAPPSEDFEEKYSIIKLASEKAAHGTLGYEEKRKIQKPPTYLTDEVKQSIEEKKKCYHRWLADKTNVNWEKYKAKSREARQANKEQKTKTWEKKCQEVESLIGGACSEEVWRTIQQMNTNQTDRFNQIISTEK
ncbi:hypothetical protein HHI36_000111, partial [Cryptolaemus montrouzieri]